MEEKKSNIKSNILSILFLLIVLAWVAIVFTDYFKVRNSEEPMFCEFNKKTHEYDDGTVTECTGLGYKVIRYKRQSYNAVEFGPIWTKIKNE